MSSKRLKDVLNTFLKDFLQISSGPLEDALMTFLQDACKMSCGDLEDVLKTYWRRLEDIWPREIYSSWSRHLEDVFCRRMTKVNTFVLIEMPWKPLKDDFWGQIRKMSSNINEVVRAVLNFLFFYYEKILHTLKAQKALKALKALNGTKTLGQKHKKLNKWIIDYFPPLWCFLGVFLFARKCFVLFCFVLFS